MPPGRPKLITDDQLREIDRLWKSGVSLADAARRLGIPTKRVNNAHYKLRMRRAMYGTDIGGPRTIQW